MTKFKAMYLAQLKTKEELERSLGGIISCYGDKDHACGCGCYYEGKPGGSTSAANGTANMADNLCSPVQ